MIDVLSTIHIQLNDNLYLKDPESSDLGKRIVQGSVELINEIGFDQFTFRKLSQHIGSTEASIYRYFESKYKVLVYLSAWYWSFMDYQLAFSITNVKDPQLRLERAIRLITEAVDKGKHCQHMNLAKVSQIVNDESLKIYLNREVDQVNKEGAFLPYKDFVGRISDIILEINPSYEYPHMLITTTIEGAHLHRFFGKHLPRLTDVKKGEDYIFDFYKEIIFKAIGKS
ncbi:MAG: TetR family transcriptional regulator [Flavobacteriales bacterium]|nr:TetR family transcriptional regulator [Flavobacteriales bacterium]